VNMVFEQAGVAYGPHLEPGSEACEEAAKKIKSDTGVGSFGKCVKVSSRKAMPAEGYVAPKGAGLASS
jgi:hypothetical protein